MVDGTFETNKLSIVLLAIVGVIITNKNFFIIYSFAKSEAVVLFNFFFDSFRYFIFSDDIVKTRVVLAN